MLHAITTKEISGAMIDTIPKGTKFTLEEKSSRLSYSICHGLGITQIWNDEFEVLYDDRADNISMSD